jgi:hypothetical protein
VICATLCCAFGWSCELAVKWLPNAGDKSVNSSDTRVLRDAVCDGFHATGKLLPYLKPLFLTN